MQYYRCKCGNTYVWTSIGVSACSTCSTCGSDLALSPNLHKTPTPHEWITKYHEDTGEPYEICKNCWELKEDVE